MNNLLASKKIVVLIIVLAVIFFVLLIVSLFLRPSTNEPAPPPAQVPAINPYQPGAASSDFKRIANPQPLSEPDAQIKQDLLNLLGNKSGRLRQTDNYDIQYVQAADWFMVEIKQGDPEIVKQEVVDYFKNRGLSQAGVCNLPVMFYLGPEAAEFLQQNNKQFNPTPPGC